MATTEDYNQVLIDQAHLLAEAAEVFGAMVKNLSGLFDDLTNYFQEKSEQEDQNVSEFEKYSKRIKDYIDQVHKEIPALTDVINKSEKELNECHENFEKLQEELNYHKEMAEKSTGRIDEFEENMRLQSSYSAAMGSILASMVWKTSKTEEVIKTFIDTGTLNSFLNLAHTTLTAFRETYIDEIPKTETYEFKLILSILGIYINIAAQKIGRDFILDREIGIDFIKSALDFLVDIPIPIGTLIKRLILMLAYNISITKRGADMIELTAKGFENIFKCLDDKHPAEIQALALTLITTLLSEVPTSEFHEKVKNQVSQTDLTHLENSSDEKTRDCYNRLMNRLLVYENEDDDSF